VVRGACSVWRILGQCLVLGDCPDFMAEICFVQFVAEFFPGVEHTIG
jgi:hypothetical protein